MDDQSNGYEAVAAEFLARRGRAHATGIGTKNVRDWARTLGPAATVLDLGCGSGFPITSALIEEGLNVYAIDAAPTFVQAFRRNFPTVPIVCEPVEDSMFFGCPFDAVLAWGLIFLLKPEQQRHLLRRVAEILASGGRFLFTSCAGTEPTVWTDAMTGQESRSLGAEEYRSQLLAVGLSVTAEYEDEGQNHYFEATKHQ
jgi:SAM-dependent methyltransferase